MVQKISEPVSVSLSFDSQRKKVFPRAIVWRARLYAVTKVGLHHTVKKGETLYHVFSVVAGNLFFRLLLDTSSLFWKLEEVSDGLPD